MEFNPTDLSYAGLFLALLIYVIRSNDKRELKYQETIDTDHEVIMNNQDTIHAMVTALNDNAQLKQDVKDIQAKMI